MIQGESFVRALRPAGFGLVSGTPCSYLTPLVNAVISSSEIDYIGAANEGEAVAIACGAQLGGRLSAVMFQNSGLGNAVSPLTSLAATFRIPLLVIATWRGQPDGAEDEPQHELMGRITPKLFELMEIPWAPFPATEAAIGPTFDRALHHIRTSGKPYGLVLRHGDVATAPLFVQPSAQRSARAALPDRGPAVAALEQNEILSAIQSAIDPAAAVLATTGFTGRALYALSDRPNQFYMAGSMGCVSSLGLGLAKVQPRRQLIVLDGDGALLMRMGALPVIAHEGPPNLVHILLDNGVHDSTGGQPTVSSSVDFAAIAYASGYPRVIRADSLGELRGALQDKSRELTFIHVKTQPRSSRKLPRPTISAPALAERFRTWVRQTL